LGAQNTYGGNTYITSNYHDAANPLTGNVRLAINNALPTTTKVILGGNHNAGGSVYIGLNQGNGKLILNGYSQTLAGLETAGTGTANRVVGGSSTTSTLTLNIADTVTNTYTGYLGGPDTDENNLALVKTGLGTLVLSAANTYTGATDVQAGVLRITHAQALGSTSAGTTVANYASVEVQGGITVNEPISLTGGGYPQATPWYGALRSTGGNNTWAGPITVSDGTRIGVRTNETFTITGGITGSGVLMFSGTASGTIRIANTPINIGGWNLVANDNTTTLLDVAGNTWGNTYISYGGTLKLGVDNAMPSATVVYIGTASPDTNGALDLNGHSQTIGGLTDAGSGTRQVINSGASASTLTISNTSDYTYAGVITGNINLVKQGTGTQTLSGANTYTGQTTVTAGVLRISSPTALGTTDGGTTVQNGARLEVVGGITVSEPVSIAGEGGSGYYGGALRSASGNNVWTGRITVNGWSRIGAPSGSTFTLQGGIDGAGQPALCGGGIIRVENTPITVTNYNLHAVDSATVIIAVTGNQWGNTYIRYGGTLKLEVDNAMPSATVVYIGEGTTNGTLDLNGRSQTIGGLTDAGSGTRRVINSGASASTLTISNTSTAYTFGGVIQDNINLVKQGAATFTLSGANTYTGTTTVEAGTLALAHTSNNNISGSSAIRVGAGATLNVTGLASSLLRLASGQTLQGNGTVQGSVEAPAGSFLGAGMSPGHLTISSNYTQAGTLVVELAGYQQGGTQAVPGQWAANGYDWVSVGGQAVLDGYVDIRLLAGFQPQSGDTFNVLTAAGGITDQGLELLWEAGSLLPAQYWSYQIVPGQGNERILQLQLGVPEPASLVLLVLGAAGLLLARSFLARKRQ
jgi:autotransporter-associated beta strand protein